jgi:hypothetical protein
LTRLAVLVVFLPILVAASGGSGALLPDLDQATPFGISIVQRNGRSLLVFGSAVDNVGVGPLVVEGRRVGVVMRARQVVGGRTYRLPTPLRYVRSETHRHWHLLDFERYELRQGGGLVGRDRKTGFCLNDAYETKALNRVPRWTGECGRGHPGALSIREGISPGFGDDYVPEKEGQSIDVTRLRPGRYVLVHRVNPDRALVEGSYANDAASVVIELRGRKVRIVARCPRTASCGTA